MMMYEVHTPECLGCGESATFSMTEEQFFSWQSGTHLQDVFPDWSPEDRERLISGTCPSCWEEMWAEDEDDLDEHEDGCECAVCDSYDMRSDPLDMADDNTYDSDWYVD